jgi:hypothetical protein
MNGTRRLQQWLYCLAMRNEHAPCGFNLFGGGNSLQTGQIPNSVFLLSVFSLLCNDKD